MIRLPSQLQNSPPCSQSHLGALLSPLASAATRLLSQVYSRRGRDKGLSKPSVFQRRGVLQLTLLLFFLLLTGCAPTSKEDFQYQGEAICRKLVEKLQKVQSREELVAAVPELKNHFHELVDLMIDARTFEQKHEEEFDVLPQASDISQQLLKELKRVYKIEAGREMVEKAQKEALLKLDAYEARRKKALSASR